MDLDTFYIAPEDRHVIDLVIQARKSAVGGLEVARVLPYARRRMVGPFIFLDHMGPAALAPGQGLDVPPHPHIGLSTVTYVFEGEILHRDSLGSRQAIRPGAVNWMTAGRGIVHSERSDAPIRASGGPMHGVQAWVALPVEHEEVAPAFFHHPSAALPAFDADGVRGRLIAGTAFGEAAPTRVYSPMFYLHWELQPRAETALPDEHEERAIYVVRGRIEVGGRCFEPGQMLVFSPGSRPVISARIASTVLALGGAGLGERYIWWNLVSSRRDRIDQAKADWAAGRMPLPPDDADERIPLPPGPKPPEPMS